MDDIARAAGMSKKTLYRLFDTKGSIVRRRGWRRGAATLDATIDARKWAPISVRRKACCAASWAALRVSFWRPRQAALYRLVIAESQRDA
jgi:AcrR family transcriptional regulator